MLAVISIIIEKPELNSHAVNSILTEQASIIKGRMGIPFPEKGLAVISLTVDAPMDRINSMNGKIGRLPSVSAKVVFAPGVQENSG